MKRTRIDLADIAEWSNLIHALWLAAKGKRQRPAVKKFLQNSDKQLEQIRQSILNGTAPLGKYRQFTIHDPKKRTIQAACFSDRVLHHAVMNLAGPTLTRALNSNTYACIEGRGVHSAALQVQQLMRCHAWYVKIDIAGYFAAIDHQLLHKMLCTTFKGDEFLDLLARLIKANGDTLKQGLPIGSLTSQYFANHYLDGADRLISEDLRRPVVRYMDDIIWWCNSREQAKKTLKTVSDWLQKHRHLQLHDNPQINRSCCGVSYCGYRIKPHALLLSRRRKQRYVNGRNALETNWQRGKLTENNLQQQYDALRAITLPADSTGFRRDNLRRHAAVQL